MDHLFCPEEIPKKHRKHKKKEEVVPQHEDKEEDRLLAEFAMQYD